MATVLTQGLEVETAPYGTVPGRVYGINVHLEDDTRTSKTLQVWFQTMVTKGVSQ